MDYYEKELRKIYNDLKEECANPVDTTHHEEYELGIVVGREERAKETLLAIADIIIRRKYETDNPEGE